MIDLTEFSDIKSDLADLIRKEWEEAGKDPQHLTGYLWTFQYGRWVAFKREPVWTTRDWRPGAPEECNCVGLSHKSDCPKWVLPL